MAVTQLVGSMLAQFCFGVITERLATRVRDKSFECLLRQDVAYFDDPTHTAGALSTRLASEAPQVKALTGERAATSTSQIVCMVVCFGVAFYQCWQMTLVMLFLIPVIATSFGVQASFVQKAAGDAMAATNEAGSAVSEALLHIRTVGAFGLEERSAAHFARCLDAPLKQFVRKGMTTGAGMGFGQFVILGSAGLAYYVGGRLYEAGEATFAEIMAVILLVMFGAVGLGQFAADASDKAEASNAAATVRELWDSEPTMDALDETKGIIPGGSSGVGDGSDGDAESAKAKAAKAKAAGASVAGHIEFRDVTFRYPMRPDVQVYNGLNLTIEPGETVALVGPSGCGKSTAVALLERFYDPQGGAVMLDGHDLKSLRLSWLRQQIGLVSQEPVLFSGSIFENIAAGKGGGGGGGDEEGGALATMAEVEEAAKLANAHTFITSADFPDGYQTQVGEKGTQLSGGQKQRIAIARAIVRDPSILILDEATSALDTASERVVQAALDGLLKAKKRTTLVIAHRLSTIRNADKVVVLQEGAVAEVGTHDSLMAQQDPPSLYSTLVKMQMTSSEDEKASSAATATTTTTTTMTTTTKVFEPSTVPAKAVALVSSAEGAGPVTDVELGRALEAEQSKKDGEEDSAAAQEDSTDKKKGKDEGSVAWIWELSAPERPLLYLGLIGSALIGSGFPLLGYFLAEMIDVFFNDSVKDMRQEVRGNE